MPRHILVTSNCQTAGVAAALRACFPGTEVTARFFHPPHDEAARAALLEVLAPADA